MFYERNYWIVSLRVRNALSYYGFLNYICLLNLQGIMKCFLLLVLAFFTSQILFAQVTSPGENTEELNRPEILKNLKINQDPRLDKMLSWHIGNNKTNNSIDGFRVEIFFSSDVDAKQKALRKRLSFYRFIPKIRFMYYMYHQISGFGLAISEPKTKHWSFTRR